MGTEFTFYDFIDADNGGKNIIDDWLNSDGKNVKKHFNAMIRNLEASPPPGTQDTVWSAPFTWPLHEEWRGFLEIRKKVNNIQYRLICKMEGREVFIVTWGYHKGYWETAISHRTAEIRVMQMRNEPDKYRRKHGKR